MILCARGDKDRMCEAAHYDAGERLRVAGKANQLAGEQASSTEMGWQRCQRSSNVHANAEERETGGRA